MGLLSLLRSWGSSVADGASRAVASFEQRLEKSRELNRRHPRDRDIGSRFFSSTMRGAGAYGFPGSWSGNRMVQVQEFRRWVHVAIDSTCSETEGVNWQVGFVHAEDPGKSKRQRLPKNKGLKRFHGKALARKKLRDWRYQKSHHAIKPHEKVTPAGPDHPLVKLLTKPNVWDDGGQLFYELVLFLKLTGNAYLWVVPNALNGLPCELWVIPSHWVFPHVGAGGIDYYEVRPLYGTGGGTLRIPANEIIHFACKNPLHKIDGFAPLQAGAEWVDVAQSIDTSRYWQFKNGCFAVGAVELGEKYDPDDQQIDAILAKFYARYQGETNSGKPIVMPPDAKYVPLTIAPVEMAYHDSAEQMRDWILALFRVPKEIAGIQDAGSEHAIYGPLLSFRIKAIIPLVRRIGNVLTRHLASRWDDHLRVWGEVPTTEDPTEVRALAKQNLELGAATLNEYRAELGMEALDDPLADEVLVDPKRIPLSMLAEQLKQQQQQAQMMQAMGGQPGQPPGQPGQKPPPQPGANGQKLPEEPEGRADTSALGKRFLDDLLSGWNPDSDEGEPAPAKHFPVNRLKCSHGENQGLPGPCPEDVTGTGGAHADEHHANAEPRARSLASKLSDLPGHVAQKVRQRVAEKYEQLQSRYGRQMALTILAAGLAGSVSPIPGGGLLAAAPLLGAAELYLRLRGGKAGAAPAKEFVPAVRGRHKAADSFFSSCDRDDEGHCLPGGGGGAEVARPKLSRRERHDEWYQSDHEPRSLVLEDRVRGGDRTVEVKPLDSDPGFSLVRDPDSREISVVETARVEQMAARHAEMRERRAREREQELADIRAAVDPKLADAVKQELAAGPGDERDVIQWLSRRAGVSESEAAGLLTSLVLLGEIDREYVGGRYVVGLRGGRPAKALAAATNGHAGQRKGSFFAECDRDDLGHCKPGTGGGGAKPKPGKQPKKPAAQEQESHPGAAHGSEVKVKLTKKRAAPRNDKGKIDPVPVKTQLTKQETGRVVEAGIRAYLRDIEGITDTVGLNTGKPNESIDLFGDSMAPEVKGGLCSNSKGAQQWRITFSMELGKKEQAEYDALTPEQQKAWREKRQRACLERKLALLKKISKERGKKINPVTYTGILNPDLKTIDIYKTDGYHQRLDWNDPKAKYVGSVEYSHA